MTNKFNSRGLDELFNSSIKDILSNTSSTTYPPLNIAEEGNKYTISLAVPGMSKDLFNLSIHGRKLTIKSVGTAKKESDASKDMKSIRREFNTNAFERSVSLSEDVDTSNISASYVDGILAVELAKSSEKAENSFTVDIQ